MASVKRFRQKVPRLTKGMSCVPVVTPMANAVKSSDIVDKWKKRRARGMELVLLAAARILIEDIQKNAPTLDDYDYSKDLSVGLVQDGEKPVVAIAFTQKHVPLEEKNLSSTVLYVRAVKNSSAVVKVLMKYSPWPAEMLPIKLKADEATVVARRVSRQEVDKLATGLYVRRSEIVGKLSAAGMPGVTLKRSSAAVGSDVRTDIGFTVLRKELGIKTKRDAHWGPAMKRLPSRLKELKKMFIEYMNTGREAAFDLPDLEQITVAEAKAGAWFSDRLHVSF